MNSAMAALARVEQEQRDMVQRFIDTSGSEELSEMTAEELGSVILSISMLIREMLLASAVADFPKRRVKYCWIDCKANTISSDQATASVDQIAQLIFMRNQIEKEKAAKIWLAIVQALQHLPDELADLFPKLRVQIANDLHIIIHRR